LEFSWSSCGQKIFSSAEVLHEALAAGLLRTNMTACEVIKPKDIPKTSLQTMRDKAPEFFKKIVKEAEN